MSRCITTASGRAVDPFAPRPSDLVIEDIAHALGALNRFNGHTSRPYSVAQHSVHVSWHLAADGPEAGLFGLLHDASEAYLGDVTTPLKLSPAMAEYRQAEARLQTFIYQHFGLRPAAEPWDRLHLVDRRMLRTEQRDLMPPPAPGEDRDDVPPYGMVITPWDVEHARARFLDRFHFLQAQLRDLAGARP